MTRPALIHHERLTPLPSLPFCVFIIKFFHPNYIHTENKQCFQCFFKYMMILCVYYVYGHFFGSNHNNSWCDVGFAADSVVEVR